MGALALIIAISFPAVAQEQKPVVASYRDFGGGLNNDDASVSIAANESPNLLNVNIDDPRGALTQRRGYQTCGTIPSGGIVTNLYEYAKNDGTRRLIVTDNTTVWQTANCIDFSTITTGQNPLELPRFATVLDDLWIVNGSTWPIVWNGSTSTQLDGVSGRPEGPIGKYISYWKSRVWIANVPTSPSSVFFSALVDESGNILDPETSTGAWISTNQIYINRDDGSPIYGMRPYRDNLYIFKETGINRILFESEFDLSLAKNVSNTGSKFDESIVEMDDGLIRFLGNDGIYAFDGSRVHRLSSKIAPTIESIKQQTGGQGFQLWDTQTDFVTKGTFDEGISTHTTDGSLELMYEDFSDGTFTDGPVWLSTWTVSGGGEISIDNGFLKTSTSPVLAYTGSTKTNGVYRFLFFSGDIGDTALNDTIRFHITSTSTASNYGTNYVQILKNNTAMSYRINSDSGAGTLTRVCDNTTAPLSSLPSGATVQMVITVSGLSITWDVGALRVCDSTLIRKPDNNVYFIAQLTKQAGIGAVEFLYKSTGVYTSQISTFTGLTQWRTFTVDETLNGQTIAYSVRTGTTAYNTSLNAWSPISPGLIISTTTNAYAQWKAEFTTTDNSVTPLINSVSMGYATGDTSATAVKGIQYKSRLWLAASTGTTNNFNDMVIVESKSPLNTYTLYDLPLSAMAIWSGNLYGAIGNTGKIARIDYGETDDGAAIHSYWDSRDEVFDNPICYKTVNQVILDYANSPANTALGVSLSPDMGATWTDRSVNLGASSLARNTQKLNYAPETALGFRTRISNSVLGFGFKIYGVHPFGSIIPYSGN